MQIDERITAVCRNLNKSGDLTADVDYLRDLAAAITPHDAVRLYCYFRDYSERFEGEWRPEFLQIFPKAKQHLPPVLPAEAWQSEVFHLVRANDLTGLKAFVSRIGTLRQTFDPKRTYAECAEMGHRERLSDVPFDFYPVEGEDEDGLNPVGLAHSLGHIEIAEYLQSIVAELDSRYFAAYEQGRQMP